VTAILMAAAAASEVQAGHGRRDQLASACRAIGGSQLAAAWEDQLRMLCADPASAASNLAAGGDPVEFQCVWSVGDGRVDWRATVDPDPAATPLARQARCLAAVSPCVAGRLQDLQALLDDRPGRIWRYGGWVGTRRRDGAFHRKLYLEIPSGATWQEWSSFAPPALRELPLRAFVPIMAGLDPQRPGIEIYGQMASMQVAALSLICDRLGFPAVAPKAIGLLQALMEQRLPTRMPAAEQGLSLAMDEAGEGVSLTWYAPCDAVLGPPARAREALLGFGVRRQWQMDEYAALSAPERTGCVPWHGVIGLTVGRDGGFFLSVTCSTRQEGDPQ
jgi:hypothetical protein